MFSGFYVQLEWSDTESFIVLVFFSKLKFFYDFVIKETEL